MNLDFNADQQALLDAVEKVAARHRQAPARPERCEYSAALERDLIDGGFFEAAAIDELGPVAAAAVVMALARLPLAAEAAASALLAPLLCLPLPGPFAVVQAGAEAAPARFLPVARTLVRLGDDAVHSTPLADGAVQATDTLFAYPMGVLREPASLTWTRHDADPAAARERWRVAIAAEIAGCLAAGHAAVLEHVKERRQFGRPLGSFQAVQHRLAECAVLIEGARWLALKAAGTGTALDARLAVAQAQRIATRVSYDLHQFMGAMGLTLEHPLHRWTYRAKLLRAELGGADRHFIAAAEAAWPAGPHEGHP